MPQEWRLASITLVFQKSMKEEPGDHRPVSLTSIAGKMMAYIAFSEYHLQVSEGKKEKKKKNIIMSNQHVLNKVKTHLTNLITFYDVMPWKLPTLTSARILTLSLITFS